MGAQFMKHIIWDDLATSGWKHILFTLYKLSGQHKGLSGLAGHVPVPPSVKSTLFCFTALLHFSPNRVQPLYGADIPTRA